MGFLWGQCPLITRVINHLLSGVSHQVLGEWVMVIHLICDSWLGSASGTSKNIKHLQKIPHMMHVPLGYNGFTYVYIYIYIQNYYEYVYMYIYIYIHTPQGLMTKPFVKASNLTIKHLDLPRRARHLSIRPVHKKMSSNTIKQMLRPATLWVFHSTYMIARWFFCVNSRISVAFSWTCTDTMGFDKWLPWITMGHESWLFARRQKVAVAKGATRPLQQTIRAVVGVLRKESDPKKLKVVLGTYPMISHFMDLFNHLYIPTIVQLPQPYLSAWLISIRIPMVLQCCFWHRNFEKQPCRW